MNQLVHYSEVPLYTCTEVLFALHLIGPDVKGLIESEELLNAKFTDVLESGVTNLRIKKLQIHGRRILSGGRYS